MKREEAPGRAMKRACRKHADKALENIGKSKVPEAIHDVRKEIKKMHAILRFMRRGLGRKEYRKMAKAMRLAAKPLSPSRDARVMEAAVAKLVRRPNGKLRGIRSALAAHSAETEWEFRKMNYGQAAKLLLKKVRRQLAGVDIEMAGWKDVAAGVQRSYRRGQSAWRQARRLPTAEHLHAWRKGVKDLLYQLDFLCRNWPPRTRQLLADLEKLGDELGDDHDLVLLGKFVREHCEPGPETNGLRELIVRRRREWQADFMRRGKRLFEGTTAAFCAEREEDWKAWRKGPP